MTTYYVRKSGNDSNDGTDPDTEAWLTIDKAANEVAAGDTVYIGSGVYREMVTMDTSGSSGSQISFIGDIDGVQTGDPGPVIISAFDSETGAVARDYCVNTNEKEFITWQYIIFDGGAVACVGYSSGAANLVYEGCEFLDCAFLAGHAVGDFAAYFNLNEGATPTNDGLLFNRCVLAGTLLLGHDNNNTAHVNVKIKVQNCLLLGIGSDDDRGVSCAGANPDTYSIGGVDVVNCTMLGMNTGVYGFYLKNTTNQVRVLNCRFYRVYYGVYEYLCTDNTMYEDYNIVSNSNGVKLGDVQQGGNSDASVSGLLVGGLADLMFYNKMGWSPWHPWEPMSLLDATYKEPSIEAGSSSYAPADDIYGLARPMGRTPADDVGAVEARIRPQKETTTTYDSSDTAIMLAGTGHAHFLIPADAAETTITVYGQFDSSYSGTKPTMKVVNIVGDSDQSDVMTANADTWEQLSCTFTPTAAGYVAVELWSYDSSGSGEAYFDLLAVS